MTWKLLFTIQFTYLQPLFLMSYEKVCGNIFVICRAIVFRILQDGLLEYFITCVGTSIEVWYLLVLEI